MKRNLTLILFLICLSLGASLACNLTNLANATAVPTEVPAQVETQVSTVEPSPTTDSNPQPADTAVPPTTPPEPDVNVEGVSFSYAPSLASNVRFEITPREDNPDDPEWMHSPELIRFTFEGYPVTEHFHVPALSVFSIDEVIEIAPSVADKIDRLKNLLAARPDSPEPPLPYLLSVPAGQVIAARIHYLEFKNGSGIVYLTQFAQDISPVNNYSLFYTFQGITNDGRWYVTAALPVNHPLLPADSNIENYDAFAENYENYLADTKTLLESQPAESYTPNLNLLDELFRSLRVK